MRSLTLTLLFTLMSVSAWAAESPDSLYAKGNYGAALPLYDKQVSEQKGEARYRSLLRAATCEALLFKYEQALTRVMAEPLPTDLNWKLRFRLFRAQLLREFLNQYGGYHAPREAEDGNTDAARKTPVEWRKEAIA